MDLPVCRAGAQWRSHAKEHEREEQGWDGESYREWMGEGGRGGLGVGVMFFFFFVSGFCDCVLIGGFFIVLLVFWGWESGRGLWRKMGGWFLDVRGCVRIWWGRGGGAFLFLCCIFSFFKRGMKSVQSCSTI